MKILQSNRSNAEVILDDCKDVTVECAICHQPVTVQVPIAPVFGLNLANFRITHNECLDKKRSKERTDQLLLESEKRLASFERMCPPEFLKKLNENAPGYNHKMRWAVAGWVYNPKGLLLIGPSGRCKTRFAWKLLQAEHNRGRTVAGITHVEFRAKISALASSDIKSAWKFMESIEGVDLLLLDDLGKGRRTPAAEEALFLMIDKRVEKNLPTIYTMNTSLEVFSANLSDEYREPLLRRIQDNTTQIDF